MNPIPPGLKPGTRVEQVERWGARQVRHLFMHDYTKWSSFNATCDNFLSSKHDSRSLYGPYIDETCTTILTEFIRKSDSLTTNSPSMWNEGNEQEEHIELLSILLRAYVESPYQSASYISEDDSAKQQLLTAWLKVRTNVESEVIGAELVDLWIQSTQIELYFHTDFLLLKNTLLNNNALNFNVSNDFINRILDSNEEVSCIQLGLFPYQIVRSFIHMTSYSIRNSSFENLYEFEENVKTIQRIVATIPRITSENVFQGFKENELIKFNEYYYMPGAPGSIAAKNNFESYRGLAGKLFEFLDISFIKKY